MNLGASSAVVDAKLLALHLAEQQPSITCTVQGVFVSVFAAVVVFAVVFCFVVVLFFANYIFIFFFWSEIVSHLLSVLLQAQTEDFEHFWR